MDLPDDIREKIYEGLREREEAFVQRRNRLKEVFRGDSYTLRKRAYICSLFIDMEKRYVGPLTRLGKTGADIESLKMEDRVRLITGVPPLDVEVSLATQHTQQWDQLETANDNRDISHLCLAIPYCDVVITERYWVDKIRREKLDKKYCTHVTSDLSFLLQL